MKTLEQIQEIPESGILLRAEGAVLRVFFNISKAKPMATGEDGEESGEPEDLCECYNVDVNAPFNYGNIIAAIVNDKYSSDDVQALQANYIDAMDEKSKTASDKREEYISEWNDFQSWRATAKEIAAKVISMLNND